MRDIWWSIAHTSGAKIYSLVLAMVTLAVTARYLGPEGRGQVVAITTWVGLFSTLGHMSLGQVAIHRATTRKNAQWLGEVAGSLLLLTVIVSALCWCAAIAVYFYSAGKLFGTLPWWLLVISFSALPLYIWEQYGSSLLMVLDRIGIYNRFQVMGRTVGLLALVVFVSWWNWGIVGAILSTIIGQLLVVLGGLRYLHTQVGGCIKGSRHEIWALLKGGSKLHLNAIGVVAFGMIDVLMINYFRGAEETGYYQLAAQLMGVMLIIPQAASMVMYGKIGILGPDIAWSYHKKVLKYTLGLICVGAVMAWDLAPGIIDLVAGDKFTPAVNVFRWLLLALFGMTFSTVMAAQWIGRGFFLQAALITVVVGTLSTISNLILVPTYGMLGAAWSANGAYSVSAVCNVGMVIFCNRRAQEVMANEA